MMPLGTPPAAPGRVLAGRYVVFSRGRECGEERWSLERSESGFVATGEQEVGAPHPMPSRQDYRVTLSPALRPTGLEVIWTVGARRLVAIHRAEGALWRVRIEYADHVKEQEGDFPDSCEVDYGTHLFSSFILARRDFAVGGEHEFTALRIGPPYLAVSPERLLYRCVDAGTRETRFGALRAKRFVASLPGSGDPGYTFWADEAGVVLESYEGPEPVSPWMELVEYQRE